MIDIYRQPCTSYGDIKNYTAHYYPSCPVLYQMMVKYLGENDEKADNDENYETLENLIKNNKTVMC